MVATFDKQSYIKYAATEINTTLLHIVMRFFPFDMAYGILLRRFYDNCEDCYSVQLNLTDRRLFLTASLGERNTTLESPSFVNVRNKYIQITMK